LINGSRGARFTAVRQWCAALTIDTFSDNQNTGQFNNTACLNTAGPEPVNFAFLTKNGKSTAPANALHPESRGQYRVTRG